MSERNHPMSDARLLDEQIDGSSHVFRMTLPGDVVSRRVDGELAKIARSATLPGFRPGKVPVSMLRKRIGAEVRDGVVDRLAIGVARQLIAERSLQPAGRPRIEIESDAADAVTFTLQLEQAPKLDLGEIGGYRLQRLHAEPPDPELDEEAELLLRRQLFDALIERYAFDVPRDMIDNEYDRIIRGFEDEVGESVDEDLAAELRDIAERRIRLALLFTEIGNAHGVGVPREEVEALVEQEAALDPEHQAEVIDYYLDHPTALAELQSPLFEDRVVAFLLERSEVEDVKMGAEELRQRLEAA
jgi:FKBP-type peptidyl-prolyl cis-trans isomerase (trigger factor)